MTNATLLVLLALGSCKSSDGTTRASKDVENFCLGLTKSVASAAANYRKFATAQPAHSVEDSSNQVVALNGLDFGLTASERGVGAKLLASELNLCVAASGSGTLKERSSKAIERFLLASNIDEIARAMEELSAVVAEIRVRN